MLTSDNVLNVQSAKHLQTLSAVESLEGFLKYADTALQFYSFRINFLLLNFCGSLQIREPVVYSYRRFVHMCVCVCVST